MKDLMFFDSACGIGSGPNIGIQPAVAELLSDMDYYGIDKALVRHGNTAMLGALETNNELAGMLRADSSGRLSGVWCILPDQCGELAEPDVFFARMKENRIAALTLFPFDHRYVPCRMTLGKIMDAAAERRIPVFISFDAFAQKWQEIYHFVCEFPRNVFILTGSVKWGIDRQIRPLLENFPFLYFSTVGYWVPEGIRDLAEIYGSERILYGSGYPVFNQGSSMLQLKQSGLSDEALTGIAGKNLENLLKGALL